MTSRSKPNWRDPKITNQQTNYESVRYLKLFSCLKELGITHFTLLTNPTISDLHNAVWLLFECSYI